MSNKKRESESLINISLGDKNLKIENIKDNNNSNVKDVNENNEIIIGVENSNKEKNSKVNENSKNLILNFLKQFVLLRVYITAISAYFAIILVDILNYVIQYMLIKNNKNNSNTEAIVNEMKKNILFVIIFGNIISPIIEELICRRLIFYFINKWSKLLAYLISSFIFAFGHFGFSLITLIKEFNNFPLYFITGVIYAYAYDYEGYILASIYAHILINFTSFFLTFFVGI
ncbi:Abi-domain-containing protein [Neocallimastix lanati (nom. inval.)]|nr:Abi-domain-containing protein [Neocallimastix sp. JGI-2020a]